MNNSDKTAGTITILLLFIFLGTWFIGIYTEPNGLVETTNNNIEEVKELRRVLTQEQDLWLVRKDSL